MNGKEFLNMNLSELVESSLKLGVVPVLVFRDKDTVEVVTETDNSLENKTPIKVLENEIKFFRSFQKRIEAHKDFDNDPDRTEEVQKKLSDLHGFLSGRIVWFEQAIDKLKDGNE